MAKINRYTKVTPSKFNPMTLQEQMMLPLAKQKRHDDQLVMQDYIGSQLQNVLRNEVDDPGVTEVVDKYQKELDSLSSTLGKEGTTSSGFRDFENLYKKYRKDVSASGYLGRTQANYVDAKTKEASYITSLRQQGFSENAINRGIERGYADSGPTLNEDGSFSQFGDFSAPKNFNHLKELMTIYSQAATNQVIITGPDSQIAKDSSGMWRVTRQGAQLNANNAATTAAALNAIKNTYKIDPERKEYLDFIGLPVEDFDKLVDDFQPVYEFSRDTTSGGQDQFIKGDSSVDGHGYTTEDLYAVDSGTKDNVMLHVNNNNYVGLRGKTITDDSDDITNIEGTRDRKIKDGNITEVSGIELEELILNEDFHNKFDKLAVNRSTDIEGSTTKPFLLIQGEFEGKKYDMAISDPQVLNLYDKYFGTKAGRDSYKKEIVERDERLQQLIDGDDFLKGMKPTELAGLYNDLMGRIDHFQINVAKPLVGANSNYQDQTNGEILGSNGNIGSLASRKVRVTTEDGTEIVILKNEDFMDELSDLIVGKKYRKMDAKEKTEFNTKLQGAHNLGWGTADNEEGFANAIHYSITDERGNTFYLKVANNQQLSGRSDKYTGIDDASQMMQYVADKKHFVADGSKIFQANDPVTGELKAVRAYKYFIQVPYYNGNTLELVPLVIYGDKKYKDLSEVMQNIDRTTLRPKAGVGNMRVETMGEAMARSNSVIEQIYRRKNIK